MASDIAPATTLTTTEELRREQQRMQMALAAGRMARLDYHVADNRFECTSMMGSTSGSSLESLNGSLDELLERVHVDDRPRVERTFREALEHGNELHLEARISARLTGRTLWLLIAGTVERDAEGHAVHIAGVARDNTARKEGQAVRIAHAHGERLRALGEMASGIAHDLNQSLALITGYSDMARQELGLERPELDRVREMVEITAQAAVEGGHALRGLLTFVRSQELLAEMERIDIGELLQEASRLTAPRWRDAPQREGRPISLSVEADVELIVNGSPAALREAITNLIFNAVDALPNGGAIRLCGRRQQDRAIVEVHDNGTGIPTDVLPRIFDPFFTTKGEQGTGLGLPQVLSIIERHTGKIDVESEPQRGTLFRLSLPAAEDLAVRPEKRTVEKAVPEPKRKLRVLVVEDEPQLARMASLVLNQRGHAAFVATSGEDAMTMLEEEPAFDLVISDLGLGPGKNGWELAEAVRHGWPGTRFVLVTGWGAAIDLAEARARGVERVIAKPYRIAELRQVADEVAAALVT